MENEQKLGIKTFLYYLYQRVGTGIAIFLLAFVIYIFNPGLGPIAFLVSIIALITVVIGVIISWFKYINCTFILGEHALIIKRGILSKKSASIPYRQIQNVGIEQSLSYRLLGVSKLVILTAGHDDNDTVGDAEGVFDVIDALTAKKLREDILRRTNVQQVETAVR